MQITHNIKEIILQGEVRNNMYYLPQIKLDRKEYLAVNDVLETIGLKWNRGKKAHIPIEPVEDIMATLTDICESGEVETLKEYRDKYQFFETPEAVINEMLTWITINKGDYVLEPSAGLGAIARRLAPLVANIDQLRLIELDYKKVQELEKDVNLPPCLCADFLSCKWHIPCFDKIVMNPPFSNNQDVKHILHAYSCLKAGGELISIASASIKTKDTILYKELKALSPIFYDLPEGCFKNSGTNVKAVLVKLSK